MALEGLRKGKEQIKSASSANTKSNYTQYISWKTDESKTIYFITPIDEVPKVLLHQFVKSVKTDAKGKKIEGWRTFMCRKDPAWKAESGNKCPLCDIDHVAREKFVALAVELETVREGKKVKSVTPKVVTRQNKDGDDVDYPQIGIVTQGAKNFFNTLVAHDTQDFIDLENTSWNITREGKKLDTTYHFFPIDKVPDMTSIQELVPSLDDILERMGSEEYYDAEMPFITKEDQPSFDGSNKKGEVEEEDDVTAFSLLKADIDSGRKTLDESLDKIESYSS